MERIRRVLGAAVGAAAVSLALVPSAQAFVYWSNIGNKPDERGIGRANLDGSHPQPRFIPKGFVAAPGSLAVSADHIYWSDTAQGLIGRANLDGTGVQPRFITTGAENTFDLAIAGGKIYWLAGNTVNAFGVGSLGRANLDGSAIEPAFITAPAGSTGDITVDAAHLYWTEVQSQVLPQYERIMRANLDGSGLDNRFIAAHFTDGLAVDGLKGPAGKTPKKPKVAKSGVVQLPQPWITCPAVAPRCKATVQAKAAKHVIGRSSYAVAAGRSTLAHFKLTATARKALRKSKRLKATVTIRTMHGHGATKRTEKVTLC